MGTKDNFLRNLSYY